MAAQRDSSRHRASLEESKGDSCKTEQERHRNRNKHMSRRAYENGKAFRASERLERGSRSVDEAQAAAGQVPCKTPTLNGAHLSVGEGLGKTQETARRRMTRLWADDSGPVGREGRHRLAAVEETHLR
eukprot:6139535-Pleurochrysis_carterae.AAC.4